MPNVKPQSLKFMVNGLMVGGLWWGRGLQELIGLDQVATEEPCDGIIRRAHLGIVSMCVPSISASCSPCDTLCHPPASPDAYT